VKTGRVAVVSDTGRRRLQNEDSFVCEPPLFAIADGMGGAQAGEVASRIAAAALEELGRADGVAVPDLIREANARVWQHSLEDPAVAGMGTTITLAVVREAEGVVEIGHVGDSRAYRVRAGELEQLTADHTLVAELVRGGRLTQEEADTHPQRSVITRAVGTEPSVDVDSFVVEARDGDLYLLCSDGLTDMLRDVDLLTAVGAADGDPQVAAETLVREANEAGGIDNVTVILFEVLDGEPEPAQAAQETREAGEQAGEQAGEAAGGDAERTAEDVAATAGVSRHGAGAGSRAAALSAVALFALAALLVLWWSIGK
jgi:protein phosphatase